MVLSRQEALRLINAPSNLKHIAILTLTYATGLRRGEVLNLKSEHIDADRNQILGLHPSNPILRQLTPGEILVLFRILVHNIS